VCACLFFLHQITHTVTTNFDETVHSALSGWKTPFWENLKKKLKLWSPIISSVGKLQCLLEGCNFPAYFLLTTPLGKWEKKRNFIWKQTGMDSRVTFRPVFFIMKGVGQWRRKWMPLGVCRRRLVAWCSGNAFDTISEVTVLRALRWVTACGQVNHLCM